MAAGNESGDVDPATVLVVDDEEDIRYLVKVNLELDGHHVITAADGSEAIGRAAQERPDLIVLDLMMPNVDGWGVLDAIKSATDDGVKSIPVIMLTAHDNRDNRIRGGIEGAIRYLGKPFSPEVLRKEVSDALTSTVPEPERRRQIQTRALTELAIEEKGRSANDDEASTRQNPSLTRLERTPKSADEPALIRNARRRLDELTAKQRELLDVLERTPSVTDAAGELQVSRSNVYASLRRIGRKLGTSSVPELLALVRTGGLLDE